MVQINGRRSHGRRPSLWREGERRMPRIHAERKPTVAAFLTVLVAFLCFGAMATGLVVSNGDMNSKQGLPDIENCVLDFTGYGTENRYVKQHMQGEYEFFYNRWIVTDGDEGEPDAVVTVPHHYRDTVLGGERLTNRGYASYRVYIHGLPVGTPIYFFNNNFIGGLFIFVNGEEVYSYGTRARTGECRSNGEAEETRIYTVTDEEPLEVVFEVSSCRAGGLTSPARLAISTTGTLPASPFLTGNIGFILLGLMMALFIFSFLINLGLPSARRDLSFALIMCAVLLLTVFSVAVFWRLMSFMRLYIYNCIMDVNFAGDILLVFAVLYHFIRRGFIGRVKLALSLTGGICAVATFLYIILYGTFAQVVAPLLVVACLPFFLFSLVTHWQETGIWAVLYGLFLISIGNVMICTAFDLLNLTISGMEQSLAYVMIPVILSVIVLYRRYSVENFKKLYRAKEMEREFIAVKAETLRAQIRPHFIFNTLTNIQAAYERDLALGNEALGMFSQYLRANADSASEETVPFLAELENINSYAELENMRRASPVMVLLDCMDTVFYLPPLSLQPFVENAFKHARLDEVTDGYIEIITYETERFYVAEVNDNGVGFDPRHVAGKSVGLKNACERLRLLSGATVRIRSAPGEGTQVTIRFPKERQKQTRKE